VPIQPYRYATITKKKRQKKKKKTIYRTYTYWYKLKERREYSAETMHDKMKCAISAELLNREKKKKFRSIDK
jgi:hypothetical protein